LRRAGKLVSSLLRMLATRFVGLQAVQELALVFEMRGLAAVQRCFCQRSIRGVTHHLPQNRRIKDRRKKPYMTRTPPYDIVTAAGRRRGKSPRCVPEAEFVHTSAGEGNRRCPFGRGPEGRQNIRTREDDGPGGMTQQNGWLPRAASDSHAHYRTVLAAGIQ